MPFLALFHCYECLSDCSFTFRFPTKILCFSFPLKVLVIFVPSILSSLIYYLNNRLPIYFATLKIIKYIGRHTLVRFSLNIFYNFYNFTIMFLKNQIYYCFNKFNWEQGYIALYKGNMSCTVCYFLQSVVNSSPDIQNTFLPTPL